MPYKITENKEKGEIYIDLDPGNEQRVQQAPGDGFMGRESIIQMEVDPIIGTVCGVRILIKNGRDDTQFASGISVKSKKDYH